MKFKPVLCRAIGLALSGVLLVGCTTAPVETSTPPAETTLPAAVDLVTELGLNDQSKGATAATVQINSAVYDLLDFENTQEAEFATRGLIDAPESLELIDENGKVVWSQKAFAFLEADEAPDTVNPSLWENTKNNHYYGLFEVVDGIYQVRGYDLANLTLIRGETGWIVLDCMMSVECAKAAMDLVEKNLGKLPVSAIIVSHPHMDHIGGIKGVITDEDVADRTLPLAEQLASGKVPIIVPENFTKYAVEENIYAGTAMGRRAVYQYGAILPTDEYGRMGLGIGMAQSAGSVSFIRPTYEIPAEGETLVIDGVEMEFQMTPGTEAPAEMNTWLPQWKALWMAENCNATLHNLYTLRGAQIRDGAAWADYICEAITRYGDAVEVTLQSHNWPRWGNEVVNEYLLNTAAIYRFIHDQTLTYINQGYTSNEISAMLKLPAELEQNWYTRQYYGTVSHNAKAVYQKYMGWYDANPVNLNPLPPAESAAKWQEYMALGSVEAVLRQAKADFEAGEYQWVAEVTNTLVYADPENLAARYLCADALEQLAYQSESGTWRSAYLVGALELRGGPGTAYPNVATIGGDLMTNMTSAMMLDYMGIVLDKTALAGEELSINLRLMDTGETYVLRFVGGVMLRFLGDWDEEATVTITTQTNALFLLLRGNLEQFPMAAKIEGDMEIFNKFAQSFTALKIGTPASFAIVEP